MSLTVVWQLFDPTKKTEDHGAPLNHFMFATVARKAHFSIKPSRDDQKQVPKQNRNVKAPFFGRVTWDSSDKRNRIDDPPIGGYAISIIAIVWGDMIINSKDVYEKIQDSAAAGRSSDNWTLTWSDDTFGVKDSPELKFGVIYFYLMDDSGNEEGYKTTDGLKMVLGKKGDRIEWSVLYKQ
jgi:hypothetical protein